MTAAEIIGIAVEVMAGGPDDEEAAQAIEARGVARQMAEAAVVFVPLAFGRFALQNQGPVFHAHYTVGDDTRVLAEHPLYIEALAAAERADRDTFRDLAMRSSETNAINAAAHAGSKLADLVLSPAAMVGDVAGPGELRTDARVHLVPESDLVSARVGEAFSAHGAEVEFSTRVYSGVIGGGTASVQLDVAIKHASIGERTLLESAGGIGRTAEAAVANAFEKFCRGSLHPILAGLIDEGLGGDQVEIEQLVGWTAILGPQLRQMKVPEDLDYGALVDQLLEAFAAQEPTRETHWLRLFYMQGPDGPYGYDVLVDNEVWPAGADIVTGWTWPWHGEAYGLRHFLVLKPTAPPGA